ncbi:caspase domain-containing protein [Mycena capillaripes]|nr:caspase domain-containing protein [Mycena capillaripes]
MFSRDIYSSHVELGLALGTPRPARKKAFLVGINGPDLEGTHDDIRRFRTLLIEKFGFRKDHDIIMMLDDGVGIQPTKFNIMATLKTFLAEQTPGDLFVFVYAGHAKQRICLDGSERDGLDEAIITCDNSEDNPRTILDDVLHKYLVKALDPGSRLVAFFDACCSETLLDLNHHICNRPGRRMRFCSGYCPRITSSQDPDVICFSACKDSEIVFESKGQTMLNIIENVSDKDPSPTFKTLRRTLNKEARRIYRSAKQANKPRNKHNVKDQQGSLRGDDESDLETLYEVTKWAPQRMNGRLKLS